MFESEIIWRDTRHECTQYYSEGAAIEERQPERALNRAQKHEQLQKKARNAKKPGPQVNEEKTGREKNNSS